VAEVGAWVESDTIWCGAVATPVRMECPRRNDATETLIEEQIVETEESEELLVEEVSIDGLCGVY